MITINQKNAPYVFVTPALILLAVFTFYPFARNALLSFQELNMGDYHFVGLRHYQRLVNDEIFWKALRNTAFYMAIQIPVMLSMAMLAAVALNNRLLKMKDMFRVGIYIPAITETVAYAAMFSILLSHEGIFNGLLNSLGLNSIPWLNSATWSKISIVMAMTWRWTGYNMIILLAGLQAIPRTLYEAAEIDGAGSWMKFLHITIPQMRPVLLFCCIMSTIGTVNLFTEPFMMTSGGPNNSSLSLGLYLYRQGFQNFNFGYAAALSVAILFLTATLSWVQMKKGGKEDGGF